MNKKIRKYFSKLGTKGGKNRWKGVDKATISAHMSRMAKLSHKKRYAQKTLEKA